MKRLMILFVMFLCMHFVSAAVVCTDGNDVVIDSKTIDVNEIERINEVDIGLLSFSGSSAMGRILSELMIDAQSVSVVDSSSTGEVVIGFEEYNTEIDDMTEENITIDVENKEETLERGDIEKIGSLWVYLKDFTWDANPSAWKMELIVGEEYLSLDFPENHQGKISFPDKTYLIELTSGHQDTSLITAYSCGSDIEITEDTVPFDDSNVSDSVNETVVDTEDEDTEFYFWGSVSFIVLIVILLFLIVLRYLKDRGR